MSQLIKMFPCKNLNDKLQFKEAVRSSSVLAAWRCEGCGALMQYSETLISVLFTKDRGRPNERRKDEY